MTTEPAIEDGFEPFPSAPPRKFEPDDRVRVLDSSYAYETHGMLGTVLEVTSWGDVRIALDAIPTEHLQYGWGSREYTLYPRDLALTDLPAPEGTRPFPKHGRGTRVIFRMRGHDDTYLGTIRDVLPKDHALADYRIILDDPAMGKDLERGYPAFEDEVSKVTDTWTFHGICHRVDVRPDHSGRETGGWVFKVFNGMRDAEGWVRADAARSLGRLLLGLPAESGDHDELRAVDF